MVTASRWRTSWPLVLLIAGLACTALALGEAARSARSNRAVADRALVGYANFAAWSYEEHLSESLRIAAQELLGLVNMVHPALPIPSAPMLGHALPWMPGCNCHVPRYGPLPVGFIGFRLGTDTLGEGFNQARSGTDGWLVDAPAGVVGSRRARVDDADRHWINQELTTLARAPLSRWGYRVLVAHHGDSTLAFTLTTMPTSWGDTIVYAVQYSERSLDSLLAATLDHQDLLPSTMASNGSNRDILSVDVHDATGHLLFASHAPAEWRLGAITTLPASYGGLTVRTRIRPELADQVVIGGLPRSRLPMLLALLALAAGLTAIAVIQLRREARFARDRASFVASASHELRTPLTQIRLVVDMLRLGREPDPVRRDASLALVDREVTRLQHLVDGVLRFARGEVGAVVVREPVDVGADTRTVVTEFAPLAAARRMTIEVTGEGAPVVLLQSGALRQVLLNLLDNAVKFGPEGQVIEVAVTPIGPHGARVRVRDRGPGVAASDRDRIWDAFERGSSAGSRVVGGNGIGLAVVRQIAAVHDGHAWVEGADGGGALFVVDFPGDR